MGRLTGKYSKANPAPSGRHFSNVSMDELEPLLETMRRIADKYNVSISSVALNYVICKGVIPLGGARDAKQAEQNAGALGWRLTNAEITELESHPITPNTPFWNRFWQHG
jgi:aryl-alcohol dehydrogenase-like predicted oxidoreductase